MKYAIAVYAEKFSGIVSNICSPQLDAKPSLIGHCACSCCPKTRPEIHLVLAKRVIFDCTVIIPDMLLLISGGAQLGDVDSETALYKLLIPVGVAPTTGMGLVLNGGQV